MNENDVMQQFFNDVHRAVVDVSARISKPQSEELMNAIQVIAAKYGIKLTVQPPRVVLIDPQPENAQSSYDLPKN